MDFLKRLDILKENKGVSTGTKWLPAQGELILSSSPVDGKQIGLVSICDKKTYDKVIDVAQKAFLEWRLWPAPKL